MGNRVKRIISNIEKEVDIMVLKNATAPHVDQSFFYVTGLSTGLFEGSYALLYPDGQLEVITSPLEEESARKGKFKVTVYKNRDKAQKLIENRLRGMKRIGINSSELVYGDYLRLRKSAKKSRFLDVSQAIMKTRAIKDESEIANIRRACDITSRMADRLPSLLHDGVVESEIAAEISYRMQKDGAEGLAFSTIIAFGRNGAEPHYTAGGQKLKRGDFIVADFGARYRRYCADITRTYLFGSATKKHREMYEFVLHLQKFAFGEIRAGAHGKSVQEVVEKAVAKSKYKGRFTHGIGHGLGLATHDGIGFTYPPDMVLEENMVLTVEPGIYIPGWGGVRIEDDIVVKKNGYEVLTTAGKDFEPVGA